MPLFAVEELLEAKVRSVAFNDDGKGGKVRCAHCVIRQEGRRRRWELPQSSRYLGQRVFWNRVILIWALSEWVRTLEPLVKIESFHALDHILVDPDPARVRGHCQIRNG